MPLQPPRQRVEPEDTAMYGSESQRPRIFPHHVRQLMGEYGLGLFFPPAAPRERKENQRTPPSQRHGYCNGWRFRKPGRGSNPPAPRLFEQESRALVRLEWGC